MDLFVLYVACLTVFVNCLVKQFAICLGVFVILLLNEMELLSVVGGALLDRPCMVFHIMCVLCLWSQSASRCSFLKVRDPSVMLSAQYLVNCLEEDQICHGPNSREWDL